jgi:hypothetical protein
MPVSRAEYDTFIAEKQAQSKDKRCYTNHDPQNPNYKPEGFGEFFQRADMVKYAKSKGLQAIAITDHDTIEGLEEALLEGEKIGFEVIPGIEISAEHSPGSMHLLGYFFDIHHSHQNISLL